MAVRFSDRPDCTTKELQQELKRVVAQLDPRPFIKREVLIGTDATAVAHDFNFVPRAATMVPRDLVTWCVAGDPTAKVVFFKASAPVIADVVVWP